ncbi:MAG: hypothetical protein RL148_2161 [Planctomycetota bacterium]
MNPSSPQRPAWRECLAFLRELEMHACEPSEPAHAAQCASCAQRLTQARAQVRWLRTALAVEPPAALRRREVFEGILDHALEALEQDSAAGRLLARELRGPALPHGAEVEIAEPVSPLRDSLGHAPKAPDWLWSRVRADLHAAGASQRAPGWTPATAAGRRRLAAVAGVFVAGVAVAVFLRESSDRPVSGGTYDSVEIVLERVAEVPAALDWSAVAVLRQGGNG